MMRNAVIPALLCALAAGPLAGASPLESLLAESRSLTLAGKWDEAARMLQDALARASDASTRAAASVELARVAADRSFFHRRDPKAARAALEKARADVRAAGSDALAADLVQIRGEIDFAAAFESHDWETPRAAFVEAARAREKARDLRGLARSTFYLGLTYEQAEKPEPAMKHYEKSLEIAEKTGDLVQQSYAHRHIGGILDDRGDLAAAGKHIEREVALRREGGFRVGVPYALLHMADFVAAHGKDPVRVAALRDEAVREAEASGSKYALSAAHLALAAASLEAGRKPDARAHAEKALAAAEAYGDPAAVAEARKLLAKT